jgi:hypothetical protein
MTKLRRAAAKLEGLPGLVGIFRGVRRRKGRWTDEPTLTCFVRRKRARTSVRPSERIPRQIDGVATDVVAIGRPRHHAAVDSADQLLVRYDATQRTSAISALVMHPDGGMVALGSGHGLLPVQGAGFATGSWSAGVRRIGVFGENVQPGSLWLGEIGQDRDYGIVRFPALSPPTALDGHLLARAPIPLARRRVAANDAVQHLASVRGFRVTGRIVAESIRGVPITLRSTAGITTSYEDVIAVVGDELPFSLPGESGSLVFDDARRALGFVVGGGRDPDQPNLDVSFVLRNFTRLEAGLDDLFSLFFARSQS